MGIREMTDDEANKVLDHPLLSALVHDSMHTAEEILRTAPVDADEVALVATAFQMGAEMALGLALTDPAAGDDLLALIDAHVLHGNEASIAERDHVILAHYLHAITCDKVASGHGDGDDAP